MDFINLKRQYQKIKKNINKDLLTVFENSNFILGEQVLELEKRLADYVGVKECITCASGTDALLIPLMAKNIKKGDAVFTTNFSYFATTEVISLRGTSPVFVDIDKVTYNIDPNHLEHQIKKVLKENKIIPKAIITVDLFGQLADYQKIKKIAKKYNLILIEDAAQSFGASYKNKKSCSFADVAATSFYPSKPFGCYGDGGAIFTNNKSIANLCRSIRVHGQGQDKYSNVRIGLNSRLDTVQSVVLLNKLLIFNEELNKRSLISELYTQNLKEHLKTPVLNQDNISSWSQYCLLAKNEEERNVLIKYLNNKNIPTAIFYKQIFSDMKLYNKDYKYQNFPVSKNISKRIFSIPVNSYLKDKEINFVIKTIKDFFKD